MRDSSAEINRIQFEMMRDLSSHRRIEIACEMFQMARDMIVSSFPEHLSEQEKTRQIYFRTYGEHLPDDFFDKVKTNNE